MAAAKHRIVTVRILVVSLVVGEVLAVGSVAAPVASVWMWPNARATQPGSWSWYVDASELEAGGGRSESNRNVLDRQARLGGIVEEYRVVPGGVNVLLANRILERFFERSRQDLERARQEAIQRGGSPPPLRATAPRQSPSVRDRTERSRATLARIPDDTTVFVRSGWPWHAAEGITFPIRPIWSGLLANTLFYAALMLLLLAALRLWRTNRRRKRGRCVACGYELGEGVSVCPECGLAARPAPEGN